jgi:hypothetical protein
MNRAKSILILLILAGLAVGIPVLVGAGYRTLGRIDTAVADADTLILQEKKDAHDTAQDLDAALLQIETTTNEVRTAAESQEDYWDKTSQQTAELMGHLNHNLNDPETGMVHNFNHAVMALTLDTHDLLNQAESTTEKVGVAANATLDAGTAVLEGVRLRVNDPRIDESFTQIPLLLTQSAGIANNINQTTADLSHEVHKLVYPPPRKWYQKFITDPLKVASHVLTWSLNK